MPVADTDVLWRLSGGASNADPNASLGGAMSTVAGGIIDDNVLDELFDDIQHAEIVAGEFEYRGFYVVNNHGSLTLSDARIFITGNTPSADTDTSIALAVEAVNVTMATIADENTAPSGVTWGQPGTWAAASSFQLNSSTGLAPGDKRGVWVRRQVVANPTPVAQLDTFTLAVEGITLP